MEKLKHDENPFKRGVTFITSRDVNYFKSDRSLTVLFTRNCNEERCRLVDEEPCKDRVILMYRYDDEMQYSKHACLFRKMLGEGKLRVIKRIEGGY